MSINHFSLYYQSINQLLFLSQPISIMNLAIEPSCLVEFENLKYKKKDLRFIIYKIEKETIVNQHLGDKNDTFEKFLELLPANEYRFAVYDYHRTLQDGRKIEKLVFLNWNPDETPLKGRVLYATTKESFKKHLSLNVKDFTFSSKHENVEGEIIKELQKH